MIKTLNRTIIRLIESIPSAHLLLELYRLKNHALKSSRLGFDLANSKNLDSGFIIMNHEITTADDIWEQPWGEQRVVRDNHNRLFIQLQQKDKLNRQIEIEFTIK